jgi:uncharacterized membrane protein
VSGKSKQDPRSNKAVGSAKTGEVRAQKRAQFEAPRSHGKLYLVLAGVALLIVVAAVAAVMSTRSGASGEAVAAQDGKITLPAAQFQGGTARFYAYDAGGTQVKYFVVADTKGRLHVALDACEVCYPKKLGYKQVGDFMQCNNCGKKFLTDKLDQETGGCNPVPVQSAVTGGNVVIAASALDAGVKYFQ